MYLYSRLLGQDLAAVLLALEVVSPTNSNSPYLTSGTSIHSTHHLLQRLSKTSGGLLVQTSVKTSQFAVTVFVFAE